MLIWLLYNSILYGCELNDRDVLKTTSSFICTDSSSGELVCYDCLHKFKNKCTLNAHKIKFHGDIRRDVNVVTLQHNKVPVD